MGVENPRVGLANVGTEEHKGDELRQETYKLLQKTPVNFIGNVEGRGLPMSECDVAVCDGFTGNMVLKTIEGVGSFMGREVKNLFMKSAKTKVAALLVKSGLKEFKKKMDPDTIGGTAFLGISKPVIKAHGSSGAFAIENAIYQAVHVAESGIIADIEANMDKMKGAVAEKGE